MIVGLLLDFSTEELREHFDARLGHHQERVRFYSTQIEALESGGAARGEFTGGDPIESLRRSMQSHIARHGLLLVMRDHLIEGETYRLSESDLTKIELIERIF